MLHREFPVNTILTELEKDSLLPAILFRTSRRQCDVDVERLSLSRVGSCVGRYINKTHNENKQAKSSHNQSRRKGR